MTPDFDGIWLYMTDPKVVLIDGGCCCFGRLSFNSN